MIQKIESFVFLFFWGVKKVEASSTLTGITHNLRDLGLGASHGPLFGHWEFLINHLSSDRGVLMDLSSNWGGSYGSLLGRGGGLSWTSPWTGGLSWTSPRTWGLLRTFSRTVGLSWNSPRTGVALLDLSYRPGRCHFGLCFHLFSSLSFFSFSFGSSRNQTRELAILIS